MSVRARLIGEYGKQQKRIVEHNSINNIERLVKQSSPIRYESIFSISIPECNHMIALLQEYKCKFDSRGLIQINKLFEAAKIVLGEQELETTQKKLINLMVIHGYLRFIKHKDGYIQFFVNFKDIVKDTNDNVIGVRW